jgi:hypothetical protein
MSEPEVDMLDTIILANPSDLRLIVGPGRQSIDVSRSALGLASPVWNRMIFGPWAEGWKKEIEFPDDDPEAVLIVLGIAHLKFKDRPKKLTYDQLVDLAIVCDKYDTVGVVRPFLTEWIGDLKMHVQPGKEEWIFYAWTFGYTTDFFVAVQTLVRESTTDADGCLLHGNKPLGGRFPPDLLGTSFSLSLLNSLFAVICCTRDPSSSLVGLPDKVTIKAVRSSHLVSSADSYRGHSD